MGPAKRCPHPSLHLTPHYMQTTPLIACRPHPSLHADSTPHCMHTTLLIACTPHPSLHAHHTPHCMQTPPLIACTPHLHYMLISCTPYPSLKVLPITSSLYHYCAYITCLCFTINYLPAWFVPHIILLIKNSL